VRTLAFDKTASWIVIGLFGVTFALSCLVPIYADELVIKLTPIHALVDGLGSFAFFPQCDSSISLHTPWVWLPGAAIDWALYGNIPAPVYLRIIGMSLFVVWFGMLLWLTRERLRSEISSLHIAAGLISFVSLGVLPFVLALNRGEETLLVGLTLICILPFIATRNRPKSHWAWALLATIFILATSITYSTHPKTLYFTPLFLVSALHLSVTSKRIWIGAVLQAGLALILYYSLAFWLGRFHCPEVPAMDAYFNSESISIRVLFSAPQEFVLSGFQRLAHSYVNIKNVLFERHYQQEWLPSLPDQKLGLFSGVIDVFISLIYFSTFVYVVFTLAKKLRAGLRAREFALETTIPTALFAGILSCWFFYSGKNFYESTLILPLFLLLAVLLFSASHEAKQGCRVCTPIFRALLITSIGSQLNLISTFTAYIPDPWLAGGQVAGQPASVSPFNYSNTRKDVIDAASNCGIKASDHNSHLVVDYSTIFTFKNAFHPIHIGYATGRYEKYTGEMGLIQFLRERNSAGVITRCDSLTPEIRKLSKQHVSYCCISQQDINNQSIPLQAIGK
jgi:hypothetical protein